MSDLKAPCVACGERFWAFGEACPRCGSGRWGPLLVAQQSYGPSVVRTFSTREMQQAYDIVRASPTRHEAPDGYNALIDELRKRRASTQAKLLEFMRGRDEATVQDIAHEVHGDGQTGDDAIRQNVRRVNRELESRGIALRFRVASGRIHKGV